LGSTRAEKGVIYSQLSGGLAQLLGKAAQDRRNVLVCRLAHVPGQQSDGLLEMRAL
jgi:hypothetical protein